MRWQHSFQHFSAQTNIRDIEDFIHRQGLDGWALVTILGDDAEIIVAMRKPMERA